MIIIHSFTFIHAPEEAQQYMDAAIQWGGGADDAPAQRLLALC
jgi:hypothetical protein